VQFLWKCCFSQSVDDVFATELQLDIEHFLATERIKIEDESSRIAVSKVISSKDAAQETVDKWTTAFQQVACFWCSLFTYLYIFYLYMTDVCHFISLKKK